MLQSVNELRLYEFKTQYAMSAEMHQNKKLVYGNVLLREKKGNYLCVWGNAKVIWMVLLQTL